MHRGDSFHYNDTGELTTAQYRMSVNGQGQFASPERTVTYQVDKAGNRYPAISEIPGASYLQYIRNALNQYTTANGATVSNGPQHEINGYDQVTYRYVADQRLASATKGSNRYELGYDALGRCVRRTSNGATNFFIYDGERPIVEIGGTGAILAKNVYGIGIDEILSRDTGTIYYYHQDRLGNVMAITNSAGYVEEQYSYDAFGTPAIWGPPETTNPRGQSRSGTLVGNRFMFTGREWAPMNLGFYEYRNRAYHPGLGRFMSEDPLGFKAGDRNLFRYCGGDPVNRVDPMGLETLYRDKLEDAITAAETRANAAQAQAKPRTERIYPNSQTQLGRAIRYVPSQEVAVLRSGKRFEVLDPMIGKPTLRGNERKPYEIEFADLTDAQKARTAALVHIHNNGRGGIARPGNTDLDENLYKQNIIMERRDAFVEDKYGKRIRPGKTWYRRDPVNNGQSYRDSAHPDGGSALTDQAHESAHNSAGPSAATVDAANYLTGVPSLGQEAINFAPGKP